MAVGIREFAERVLFGTSLAEKLAAPLELTDLLPGPAIGPPAAPGRPANLRMTVESGRAPMPGLAELERPAIRGQLLHFFANHELLALELMALSLLRFPNSPAPYRQGVVHTMREEQEHLRQYLERMTACGVAFGEQPVNDFFWRWLADMRDPSDFVAHMNLTFEQANLDYAEYYAGAFARVGDDVTAALLGRIVEDEIGHVRHGLTWFNRWRDPEPSLWDAYRNQLRAPLGPFRAKGIGFNRKARERAGFPSEYIEQLAVACRSQGRPPTVHWFHPDAEAAIVHGRGYSAPLAVRELTADLETLPMYMAASDDVVWVRKAPRAAFLAELAALGFDLPEFVAEGTSAESALRGRRLLRLAPWGWSPQAADRFEPLRASLLDPDSGAPQWTPGLAAISSKAWSVQMWRRLLQVHGTADTWLGAESVGQRCATTAEVEAWLARTPAVEQVIKPLHGAAGNKQFRLTGPVLEPLMRRRLDRLVREQSGVVIEPWLNRVLDLSFHFWLTPDGRVRSDGWLRFLTDSDGRFRGAVLGRRVDGLAPGLVRFLYGDGREPRRLDRLTQTLADHLAPTLREAGYFGPVGVDALVAQDAAGRYRLKPIVEVNPRYTMGRLALALQRHLWRGRAGLFLLLSASELRRAGYATPKDFALAARRAAPAVLGRTQSPFLRRGICLISDPERATRVLGLLSVAPCLEHCWQPLQSLGLGSSEGRSRGRDRRAE